MNIIIDNYVFTMSLKNRSFFYKFFTYEFLNYVYLFVKKEIIKDSYFSPNPISKSWLLRVSFFAVKTF